MDYYFNEVNPDNLKDVQFLIEGVYGVKRDINILKKKYDTTDFGLYTVGLIAYSKEDNSPAAYYGVFPCVITYAGRKILASQSGDTMTHPNHRKKGLFVTLAKKTFELAKQKGIAFVFGFPVEASYYGFVKKLDWKHDKDIQKYQFLTPFFPYSVLQKIIPFHRFLRFSKVLLKPFLNKHDYPYSNISSKSPHIYRDHHFYDYKDKSSNFNIKFMGLKVWFQINGVSLIVGDLEFNGSIKKQIFKLKILASYLGLLRVVFHVSENSNLNNDLSKYYNSTKGIAIGYLDFENSDFPFDDLNFIYSDFDTF